MLGRYCFALFLLGGILYSADAFGGGGYFNEGDMIPVKVVKIGPYHNPSETYNFYSLPFCRPQNINHPSETLGMILSGDRISTSVYNVPFKRNVVNDVVCRKTYTQSEMKQFRNAVDKDYFFEMNFDGLPIWNFLGASDIEYTINGDKIKTNLLFTHFHFQLGYNENRVVSANVTVNPEQFIELKGDEDEVTVQFTYSATWRESTLPFKNRLDVYTKYNFFPRELEIHWLSILNSFVLVILLVGFVSIILTRILKNDYTRYSQLSEDLEDDSEEYGWKLIHGDVFRFPRHPSLFSAFIGVGTQFLCTVVSILLLAALGYYGFSVQDGAMISSAIFLYAVTCGISGFTSASLYTRLGGYNWVWNIILVSSLFTIPLMCVWMFINTLASFYHSTMALPFTTVLLLFSLWLFFSFPLHILGGIAGKNSSRGKELQAPVRTKKIPRQIPALPWYRSAVAQVGMAGFLPFSAIYIELYYIFASVWGHRLYTLYGILLLVFAVLLLVTASITIALTYFQLAAEDYRWWWRSFASGGSTGMFMYLYCFFYWSYRTEMSGVFQGAVFFGYMFLASFAFALMLGTVGWFSSLMFVRKIYRDIKCD